MNLNILFATASAVLLSAVGLASEGAIKMKDLPAAVGKTVEEQSKGAALQGLSKEMKDGRTYYEAAVSPDGKLLGTGARAADEKVEIDKLPQKVAATLKAKFSGATITSATKETENGEVIYDIEMKKEGRKHEMDVKEDGTIVNFENEIAVKDLPAAVTNAVRAKYPNRTIKEAMEVMVIKDKKDLLEEYEVLIETADKKDLELAVSPDGTLVK
jgi:uncharacterized membrane protein YkoI